jgi:hypothetical protein
MRRKFKENHVYYSPEADAFMIFYWYAADIAWFDVGGNAEVVNKAIDVNLIHLGKL